VVPSRTSAASRRATSQPGVGSSIVLGDDQGFDDFRGLTCAIGSRESGFRDSAQSACHGSSSNWLATQEPLSESLRVTRRPIQSRKHPRPNPPYFCALRTRAFGLRTNRPEKRGQEREETEPIRRRAETPKTKRPSQTPASNGARRGACGRRRNFPAGNMARQRWFGPSSFDVRMRGQVNASRRVQSGAAC